MVTIKTLAFPAPVTDRDEAISRIREALQRRSGKTWSVTGGRGTAWGWIKISVPPKRLACDRGCAWDTSGTVCRFCGRLWNENAGRPRDGTCPAHTPDRCDERCSRHYISPEERAELGRLLGLERIHFQGVSIPASGDHRTEYVDRAEGRVPRVHGEQYWD